MPPYIKKILYATDMSENSKRAFQFAASLGQRYDAKILVVYVLEPVPQGTYMNISGILGDAQLLRLQEENEDRLQDQLSADLRRFCDQLQSPQPACPIAEKDIFIRKGVPVEEIVALTNEQDIDMIVMGTHGYGLFKDALMGGTVRRVLRRSKIPVLVVRNQDRSGPD